jgi:exosortase/archaeosortase family protein
MNSFLTEIGKYIKKYKLYVLRDVAIFVIITLTVHITYRYWANTANYWPIEKQMNAAHEEAAWIVFNQSFWFIDHVLNIPVTADESRTMHFEKNGFICIDAGCSGLKPILQFILLMLIFPGPWKHKAWFIPMGIVIVHLTNLFRITGLAFVTVTIPQYWEFSHDYLFRPFFYVVIFLLWVWWVEKWRASNTWKV